MKQISDKMYDEIRQVNNRYALMISSTSDWLFNASENEVITPEQYEMLSKKFEQSVMHDTYELAHAILQDVQKNEDN